MYCTSCGTQIDDQANFCERCGRQTTLGTSRSTAVPQQRLTRYMPNKMVAGVCSGFAKYLGVDVVVVRLVWIALFFFPVPGALIAYILAWFIVPAERLPAPVIYPMPAATT